MRVPAGIRSPPLTENIIPYTEDLCQALWLRWAGEAMFSWCRGPVAPLHAYSSLALLWRDVWLPLTKTASAEKRFGTQTRTNATGSLPLRTEAGTLQLRPVDKVPEPAVAKVEHRRLGRKATCGVWLSVLNRATGAVGHIRPQRPIALLPHAQRKVDLLNSFRFCWRLP